MISGLAWETSDGSAKLLMNKYDSWPLQYTGLLWPVARAVWNLDAGTYLQFEVQPQPWTSPAVPVGLAPQSRTLGTWGLTFCWEAKSFALLLSHP